MSGAAMRTREQLSTAIRCAIAATMLVLLAYAILGPRTQPTIVPHDSTFTPPTAALTYDPATADVAFDVGDDTASAILCVIGTATSGVEKLFAFNAKGRGEATAAFQRDANGTSINTYNLYKGAALVRGEAADASCGTGILVASKTITSQR